MLRSQSEGQATGFSVALVLGSILSVQAGSALATTLFDDLGPAAAAMVRSLFAAVVLVAIWRPSPRRLSREALYVSVALGISLSCMNLLFYESIDRLPLGVAVTLEFVGPLGVAVYSSRRPIDLLWTALAAVGILLLAGGLGSGGGVDGLGAALALAAGCFWGAYILIAARVGKVFEGGEGLAIAMVVSTLLLLPAGAAGGGAELLDPGLIAVGFAVAMLSSLIPYTFELEALRRLPPGVFGVMMSLEPAVAATIGLIALGQDLAVREVVAIALVITASAGALRSGTAPPPLES